METQFSTTDDLLNLAGQFFRDAQAQCSDVAAMAFPSGYRLPSDEMVAAVVTKLRFIVGGIEQMLEGGVSGQMLTPKDVGGDEIKSWKLLSGSGFLQEPALIDFALARFAEERLAIKLTASLETSAAEQLPNALLSSGDAGVADAAQAMLASASLVRRAPKLLYRELSPELLQLMVWRVVAALQIVAGEQNPEHIVNAKQFLAGHDESQAGRVAARKLVYFLPVDARRDAYNPEKAGLAVFVAALSAQTGLEYDHVVRLIDGHSSAPLTIMLRHCALDRDAAMAVLCLFKGFDLTPYEVTLFNDHYAHLDQNDVTAAISKWSAERLTSINFPGAVSAFAG